MIDINVKVDGDPQVLADLIASTLHGLIIPDPDSELATIGRFVRDQQEMAEQSRPSRQQIETVNFTKLDDEDDFSDV
jgi:hypothetical protein